MDGIGSSGNSVSLYILRLKREEQSQLEF